MPLNDFTCICSQALGEGKGLAHGFGVTRSYSRIHTTDTYQQWTSAICQTSVVQIHSVLKISMDKDFSRSYLQITLIYFDTSSKLVF